MSSRKTDRQTYRLTVSDCVRSIFLLLNSIQNGNLKYFFKIVYF
jgi:hypothetical protein